VDTMQRFSWAISWYKLRSPTQNFSGEYLFCDTWMAT